MHVHISDLTDKLTLTLTGDEPWLARTHADFPLPAGAAGPQPKITGTLTVERESNATFMVDGHLSFAPVIPCRRCDAGVPYPVEIDVQTRFYNEDPKKGMKDRMLSRDELDAYYVEDGEINLEELVNDLVQTAVPAHVAPDDDVATCTACADAVGHGDDGTPVATGGAKESPFAALKSLKLKH